MKILIVDVNYKRGSTGKIVSDLKQEYDSLGHKTLICYGRGPRSGDKDVYKFGNNLETIVHGILTRITGYTGYFSFFSTQKLIRIIKRFNPDIVHIHELHAYFVNVQKILNFLKKSNYRTVFTMHCEFLYTGKCGYSFDCEKWKNECRNCQYLRHYPSSWLFDHTNTMFRAKRRAFSDFDYCAIVAPSSWLLHRIAQSFLSNKPKFLIYNGIDTSVFKLRTNNEIQILKEELGIKNKQKIVLSLAPNILSEIKGGMFVFELAKMNPNLLFICVGVEKMMDHPKNVILIGKENNKDKLAVYYSMADCFFLCSKKENFPTTCLESLCCGTQIVGFDVGGAKETADEPYGFFSEYANIDNVNNNLSNILKNPLKKEDVEKYGKSLYSCSVMAEKYLNLYASMVNLKRD